MLLANYNIKFTLYFIYWFEYLFLLNLSLLCTCISESTRSYASYFNILHRLLHYFKLLIKYMIKYKHDPFPN
jgi:hypothetical protein